MEIYVLAICLSIFLCVTKMDNSSDASSYYYKPNKKEKYDLNWFICKIIVALGFGLFIINLFNKVFGASGLIQICFIGLSIYWLSPNKNEQTCTACGLLIALLVSVIMFMMLNLFQIEASLMSEQNQNSSVLKGISWDYSNPEIVTVEYPIMGVSDENITVNVSWNGENTLRLVPVEELKVEYSDSTLKAYIYRKNYIYTEFNYDENPPKELRKDSSTWSEYILCGSEKQIQSLLGYEEKFDFEQ